MVSYYTSPNDSSKIMIVSFSRMLILAQKEKGGREGSVNFERYEPAFIFCQATQRGNKPSTRVHFLGKSVS